MRAPRSLLAAALATLIAFAVLACGGEATKDLATMHGDGFSVSMPGTPRREVQSVLTARGTLKAVSYTSDSRDEAFSIGYSVLPTGITGDLEGAIAGGARNVGGTVRDEVAMTYRGYRARDARITGAASNEGTLFVRAILAKKRLYLLQFIGEGPNLAQAPPAYTQIVKSLRIR